MLVFAVPSVLPSLLVLPAVLGLLPFGWWWQLLLLLQVSGRMLLHRH